MIKHFYKFVNRKHRKNKEKTRKKVKTKQNKKVMEKVKSKNNQKNKYEQIKICQNSQNVEI